MAGDVRGLTDPRELEDAVLEFATEFILLVSPRGRVRAGVGRGLNRVGDGSVDRRGRYVIEHIHPEDRPIVDEVMARAVTNGPGYVDTVQVRVQQTNGAWLRFEMAVFVVIDDPVLDTGAVLRIRGLGKVDIFRPDDIGDSRFLSLAEALPTGVMIATADGTAEYANDVARQILGLERGEVGDSWLELVDPQDLADVTGASALVARTGHPQDATFRLRTTDGPERWVHAKFVPAGGDSEGVSPGVIIALDDATDRLRADAELAHRATHDALTGLPNRTLLEDRLERACSRLGRDHEWVSVLFADLDGFKEINDALGHRVGDDVLRQVAARWREAIRPTDTIARLGGDEFVAVLEGADGDEAAEVAGRMHAALAEPFAEARGRMLRATIGVASTTMAGDCTTELLTRADAAMYRQKRH
jgi:diguanylate cyclase (GGDEF)-like protein/PAS domain S-box-containing protein